MNRTDYSRPRGFARWGWTAVAFDVLFVALNLACLIWLAGGWYNWAAVAVCTVSGIYCWLIWRGEVRRDATHRAYMRGDTTYYGDAR